MDEKARMRFHMILDMAQADEAYVRLGEENRVLENHIISNAIRRCFSI